MPECSECVKRKEEKRLQKLTSSIIAEEKSLGNTQLILNKDMAILCPFCRIADRDSLQNNMFHCGTSVMWDIKIGEKCALSMRKQIIEAMKVNSYLR